MLRSMPYRGGKGERSIYIGRRLPLQLQCSYQGQQGDVRQSVRGNYKTRFRGGQYLTAVEGNASVYQVNPVSRMSGFILASVYILASSTTL